MTTTDDPTSDPRQRARLLPSFRQPDPPAPTPEAVTDQDPQTPRPAPADAASGTFYRPATVTPTGRAGSPRTGTSSAGDDDDEPIRKPSKGEATALVAGLLTVVAVGAAAIVRLRAKRKLRQPTDDQIREIAAPLGRIALRLVDLSWLGKNTFDAIQALTAAGAYVNDGPLLLPDAPDPGIPHDLNGAPQ